MEKLGHSSSIKSQNSARISGMAGLIGIIQLISGLATLFFILAHEPKSEGLGSIGGAAGHFGGVRTSADDRLDQLTWVAAGTFMLCSALLGLGIIS